MKKLKLVLIALSFFLCTAGLASALTFDDYDDTYRWIDFNGLGPDRANRFTLDLPGWFDSDYLEVFDITLEGINANTTQWIELFLKDQDRSTGWINVGTYQQARTDRNAEPNNKFSHTYNLIGSVYDFSLLNGDPFFKIAYGCHFGMVKTSVHIEQRSAVPEPTTIVLFGIGLVGIAGFGRKKFKKKN